MIFLAFVAFITSYIFVLYSGRKLRSDSVVQEDCSLGAKVTGDVTFLWIASTICLAYLMLRELMQFGIAPKRYIFSLENWVEIALIAMTSFLLFGGELCSVMQCAVTAVLRDAISVQTAALSGLEHSGFQQRTYGSRFTAGTRWRSYRSGLSRRSIRPIG